MSNAVSFRSLSVLVLYVYYNNLLGYGSHVHSFIIITAQQ